MPYFARRLCRCFRICREQTLIWLDGADRVEAEAERFGRLAWERNQNAKEEHRLVAPVEALYLNEHQWRDALTPFSLVHGESLTIMAASDRAQATTLNGGVLSDADIRQETALHGKDASLAPLVDRLKVMARRKG